MNIHFQNEEMIRLCERLNYLKRSNKFRVIYGKVSNSLDFITDGEIQVATALEVDVNENLFYRLNFKYFDLQDGRTGYCLPMDLIFKQLDACETYRDIEIQWTKNRLYPCIFLSSHEDYNSETRNLVFSITREINNLLKLYLVSPPLKLLVKDEALTLADILHRLVSSCIENHLLLPDGLIKNVDPFPRITFHHNEHFHLNELIGVMWHHTRDKESIGEFINY